MTSLEVCGKNLPSSNELLLCESTKRIKERFKLAVKRVGGYADVGREDFSVTIRSGTAWAVTVPVAARSKA